MVCLSMTAEEEHILHLQRNYHTNYEENPNGSSTIYNPTNLTIYNPTRGKTYQWAIIIMPIFMQVKSKILM